MEEKLRFVFEYEQGQRSMTELCQRYQIARETGYVWIRRYRERGLDGLVEQSRAARRHGNQTAAEIEQKVSAVLSEAQPQVSTHVLAILSC